MIPSLPTPLVTAHIDERGNVTIAGEEPAPEQPRYRARAIGHCTECGVRGHARSNRKFHPRAA